MTDKKTHFWYAIPSSLLTCEDWNTWRFNTKTKYPIQYFFRDTLPYLFRSYVYLNLREAYWFIYRIISPCHKDIHKAIPRHWTDVRSLIEDVNFAMIKSFKKEAEKSWVDWDGTTEHRKFKNWLDAAFDWVTVTRPDLLKQIEAAHPPYPLPDGLKDKPYEVVYSQVNTLEKIVEDTDTGILKQMIEYRSFMWT